MSTDRPPRPDALDVRFEEIPAELQEREQWVCWRFKWDNDRDEWTKVPVDVTTGGFASATDPDTWSSFDDVRAYHERGARDTAGVGFVVADDLVLGLDLDDCRDPERGVIEPWAGALLEDVDTYAEVSPSGTGLRAFAFGILPDGGNRADVDGAEGHLEMYDKKRYLTVTGHRVDDAPDEVHQVNDAIAEIHARHIADGESGDSGDEETPSDGSNPGFDGGRDDSSTTAGDLSKPELIERAKNAKNGDKFTRLWEGRADGSGSAYESRSEADLALAALLAWWTGGDRRRTDRLFRQSGLMRDKWERETYRGPTLDEALDEVEDGYDPSATVEADDRRSVPPPEELIAEIERGERSYDTESDDVDEADERPPPDPADKDWLKPIALVHLAGLDRDEGQSHADVVGELSDREATAYVWELLKRSGDLHVRVRRDNSEIWAFDRDRGVWVAEGERALRHAARRALTSVNYGQNVLTELKAQARADPSAEVPGDAFGLEAGQLAVANGVVDLDAAAADAGDDALRDLEPEDYALTRLPVDYDPDASADEWAEYVNEWAEDGKGDALQEYVGYCLHIGEMPIHRALLLVGSGANGKGTFLSVVRALLGRENTSSIELQTLANERDAVADFYGVLANIDDDLSARKLGRGRGMFKKLVGGDRVRARRLYQNGFEFGATGKHLYAANEVPNVDVSDDDEAFWRRWLLVEFPNYYPPAERDHELVAQLTNPEVLSGVLNWAIEGRRQLLEQGYFTDEHRYAHEKRARWQAWGDSVDKFIEKCLERDEDARNWSTQQVHRRYTAWCRENGLEPVGQQQLTNQLKREPFDYGKKRVDGVSTRAFGALSFSDEVPPLDDDDDDRDGRQTSF